LPLSTISSTETQPVGTATAILSQARKNKPASLVLRTSVVENSNLTNPNSAEANAAGNKVFAHVDPGYFGGGYKHCQHYLAYH
jgi:hypothetical protein